MYTYLLFNMNAFSCALNDKNVGADFVQSCKEFQISIPRSRAVLSNNLSLPFGFLNNFLYGPELNQCIGQVSVQLYFTSTLPHDTCL